MTKRVCTHLQATHIFDGLEEWPTHIMFLSGGKLKLFKKAEDIPELAGKGLLHLVEGYALHHEWLAGD